MSERPRRTADELLKELERKPEYVERQRERLQRREEKRALYAAAAKDLLDELHEVGLEVSTLSELRQRGGKRAVPVLAKWLPEVEYVPLKQDIIGLLGSPWARPDAARPLLDEFRRIDSRDDKPGGLRWSIGDALGRVADESVLDDMVAIATDPRQGRDRQLFVAALGSMVKARDRVIPVLLQLLDEPEVAGYAVMGLGKLRVGEARPAIERFREHPEAWVRKEAKKALSRLAS